MQNAYVITGQITDSHTVTLDENLPLSSARVRVVLEVLSSPAASNYGAVIARIRERQKQRGHQPPNRAVVDNFLQDERANWES